MNLPAASGKPSPLGWNTSVYSFGFRHEPCTFGLIVGCPPWSTWSTGRENLSTIGADGTSWLLGAGRTSTLGAGPGGNHEIRRAAGSTSQRRGTPATRAVPARFEPPSITPIGAVLRAVRSVTCFCRPSAVCTHTTRTGLEKCTDTARPARG